MNMPQALARGLSALVLVAAFAPLPALGFAQPAVAAPMDRADPDKASRPAADMRPAKAGVVADLPPKPAAVARSSAKSCHQCDLVAATSLFRASMTGLFEAPE